MHVLESIMLNEVNGAQSEMTCISFICELNKFILYVWKLRCWSPEGGGVNGEMAVKELVSAVRG